MSARLVQLTACYSVVEARICISMLQAYGIYVCAPHELVGNCCHRMILFGPIPIQVIDRDYEQAKALLLDIYAEAARSEAAMVRPEPRKRELIAHAVLMTAFTLMLGISPVAGPLSAPGQTKL